MLKLSPLRCTAVLLAVSLLAACGKKHDAATQSAARVNGAEITVHEINFLLQQQQRGALRPEQMAAASKAALERLIDLQLLAQKAKDTKLDEQPRTQQVLEATRRDVLARAYTEGVGRTVKSATDDQIRKYFDDNPALFLQRRSYEIEEVAARVPADAQPDLKARVVAGKGPTDLINALNAAKYPNRVQTVSREAEQLPLALLPELAKLPDGHGIFSANGDRINVAFVLSSKPKPVTFEQAHDPIAAFLVNKARRKAISDSMDALRAGAKFEFSPAYADLGKQITEAAAKRQSIQDADKSVSLPVAEGERVSLPAASAVAGERISLPASGAGSGVTVKLPDAATPSVRVSLPASATESVRISLPQTAPKK